MEFVACPLKACKWDTRGTKGGAGEAACGPDGSIDYRCLFNWMSADPEDREPYEVYITRLQEAVGPPRKTVRG